MIGLGYHSNSYIAEVLIFPAILIIMIDQLIWYPSHKPGSHNHLLQAHVLISDHIKQMLVLIAWHCE
jgi:hypothetical protein